MLEFMSLVIIAYIKQYNEYVCINYTVYITQYTYGHKKNKISLVGIYATTYIFPIITNKMIYDFCVI